MVRESVESLNTDHHRQCCLFMWYLTCISVCGRIPKLRTVNSRKCSVVSTSAGLNLKQIVIHNRTEKVSLKNLTVIARLAGCRRGWFWMLLVMSAICSLNRLLCIIVGSVVGGVVQWWNVGLWPANFLGPALELCWRATIYVGKQSAIG